MKNSKHATSMLKYCILIVTIIIVTVLLTIILTKPKSIIRSEITEKFSEYYLEEGLITIEDGAKDYFGLDGYDQAILLSNFDPNVVEQNTENPILIMVVESRNNLDVSFDSIKGYCESMADYSGDGLIHELYKNAILKKGNNYFYLIMSMDNKIIESELLNFINA